MLEASLFDDIARFDRRPKLESEPMFAYYNHSARPAVASLRRLLEAWFSDVPDEAKVGIRARVRSGDDIPFQSAFFELYLHALMTSMGFSLVYEPEISGSSTRPDFLVSKGGTAHFYLEATVAAAPQQEQAMEKRAAVVYDSLNRMRPPSFFLHVRIRGAPATPPNGARLRSDLERWLSALDPDEVARRFDELGLEGLPEYEWRHAGWELAFSPIPKAPEHRGSADVRPIGSRIWGGWLQSHQRIRSAVVSKAKAYGGLRLPLLVAVNILDDFAEDIDVMNALFGEEFVSITTYSDGRHGGPQNARKPDGAWVGPRGPRARDVSGVIIGYHLDPWRIGVQSPQLIHHPWARRPLRAGLWALEQWVADIETGRYATVAGSSAAAILDLPVPWPPEDD